VASVDRAGRTPEGTSARRYVASLLWPGRLPRPANDNRLWRPATFISLAAAALLLATAAWAIIF
jgi:hypothetical protein